MGGVFSQEKTTSFIENVTKTDESHTPALPWSADVEVDWNGCRKFGRLPPAGEHPRLFFTAEEIPRFAARFTHSTIAAQLKSLLLHCRNAFLSQKDVASHKDLSEEERRNPSTKETVDKFFKADECRNVFLLSAYIYGILFNEPETARRAKEYAVFHAKIVLKSRELAIEQNIRANPYNVWHSTDWTVPIQFLFGGTCYALLYDLVYNELDDDERNIIRTAISTMVRGRTPWGMGWPARRIQSNWALYHGDFYTLSAVIEGEDKSRSVSDNMSSFADLMVHFLDYGVYDSGHPVEDAYVVNLALREGSLCFLAMTRRGHNVFNHPHYKRIWTKWLPYALELNNSGNIYGGSSGSDWSYPTSAIVAKFMFPKDRAIDYVYRRFMNVNGNPYARLGKIQCRLSALLFAIPSTSQDLEENGAPENLFLPLDFVCRDRGKMVMLSDWSENSLSFTFDARPDAFLIGHDTCSRGAFVLNARGRNWGYCPEWKWFRRSSDYSTPMIDNRGQELKAPLVNLTTTETNAKSSFASSDLTYAYNWRWTENARQGQDFSKDGSEIETSDPRDFGFNPWWGPHKLHGENEIAFVGLHIWRKRFNNVRKVTRSVMLVRDENPFVLIADDVDKGDDRDHEYTWAMTTPGDVKLDSFDGEKAVLGEHGRSSTRQLVIQNVTVGMSLECHFREIERPDKAPGHMKANQIRFFWRGQNARFRFLIYSIAANVTDASHFKYNWTEATSSDSSDTVLTIDSEDSSQSHNIAFTTQQTTCISNATKMTLLD